MNYETMWKAMKSNYETHIEELENAGEKGSEVWQNACQVAKLMTTYELKQTNIENEPFFKSLSIKESIPLDIPFIQNTQPIRGLDLEEKPKKQNVRREKFLTKQSKILKFTKGAIRNLGLTAEEVQRLFEMEFIIVAPLTLCSECLREIKEEDCQYCGHEEAAVITNDFFKYNEHYKGPLPPFE